MNSKLLNILACPVCGGELSYDEPKQEVVCVKDNLAFAIQSGMPIMLSSQARTLSDVIVD